MEPQNIHVNKSNSPLGHRRQASIGLGIITNLDSNDTPAKASSKDAATATTNNSKNASFFETSDITVRPPPRLYSMDKSKETFSPIPTPQEPAATYASRLRNIVANMNNNNKHNSTSTLTPISNSDAHNINAMKDSEPGLCDTTNTAKAKVRRARSYRLRPPYHLGEDDDDDDEIMPLPSPLPTSTTSTSSHRLPHDLHVFQSTQHHHVSSSSRLGSVLSSTEETSSSTPDLPAKNPESTSTVTAAGATPSEHTGIITSPHSPVTPPSPSTSTSIPIIAISPTFVHRNDVIPQLSEHPMLGDMDDRMLINHAPPPPSQQPNQHYQSLDHHHHHQHQHKSQIHTNKQPTGGGMVREVSQSSNLPTLSKCVDEDFVDKQLGHFYIRRLLGTGAFSKVYLAERHPSSDGVDENQVELFAIKTINKVGMLKNPRVRSSIEREVGILKFIDHPHIVRIEATMETEHSLCIILQYAEGVELFDYVQQLHQRLNAANEKVDENLIKKIFLQLVRVVKWMHKHNIVHRDLKLENILIQIDERHPQGEPILKVTDFGLARVIDPDSPILTTRCGSEEYAAPEIVQSKGYDGRQTDTWALGIILYSLLVGYLPFRYDVSKGERVTQMFYRIVRAQIKWPKTWDHHHHLAISPEAKDVVERILVRQPELRLDLDNIDRLPWFQQS
ncbi:kinase-like domain-containing protein [Absidia repens]|uniref:non-specific serine/threonine protein kinase n=1 Tax=Absidia repens TaxID=90262 RepID=A0A1X2IZC4_9FUNG|nr:kinase-like domain-containing protein [Absidia repens]